MGRPIRTAELGTVGSVTDDLKILRSKGGLRSGGVEDLAGTLTLLGSSAGSATDRDDQAARELLRSAAAEVCNRVREQGSEGLRVGGESLERLMLSEIPLRNQVQDVRMTVAGKHGRGPDYVSEYEDQVIALVAREVFQTVRPSGNKPALVSRRHQSGNRRAQVVIREAIPEDHDFVVGLMTMALSPFYGGDHVAHAERIFSTHVAGGIDHIGHFSVEQRMFIATVDDRPAGMIHLVGKRQKNYKISPLIVDPTFRGGIGLGRLLVEYAELYAKDHHSRQMYCTVAETNDAAVSFFTKQGYVCAGHSESHYKEGVTELMLFKPLNIDPGAEAPDRPNISVLPCEKAHEDQVRQLLLSTIANDFFGIDDEWIDALFAGYYRRLSGNINDKYKLLYVAVDRHEKVLGVVGATPKKGEPIKLMPFVASNEPSFLAFLADLPYQLLPYGHKLYAHLTPTPAMVIALQQHGWKLDAAMPQAYHDDRITYQWSLDVSSQSTLRTVRVKNNYLDFIRAGRKTLEVRVGYDNIKAIKPNDLLHLTSYANEQLVRVVDVRTYYTFDDMLRHEEADQIVPGLTASEVLSLLREIYPPRREKLGIVVLEIERLPNLKTAG